MNRLASFAPQILGLIVNAYAQVAEPNWIFFCGLSIWGSVVRLIDEDLAQDLPSTTGLIGYRAVLSGAINLSQAIR